MLDCQVEKAEARAAATAANGASVGDSATIDEKQQQQQQQQRKKRSRPRIIGIREHMRNIEEQRLKQTGPDSWLTRKFAVGMVIAIFGYSYYVYVVRLCVKMVRLESDRQGGRAQGVIYLALYHILFCMFVWSYIRVIITGPGFAKDYVPQTEPPIEEEELVQVEGYRFEQLPRGQNEQPEGFERAPTMAPPHGMAPSNNLDLRRAPDAPSETIRHDDFDNEDPPLGVLGPAAANLAVVMTEGGSISTDPQPGHSVPPRESQSSPTSGSVTAVDSPNDHHSSVTPSFPPRAQLKSTSGAARPSGESITPSYLNFPEPPEGYKPAPVKVTVERTPPQVPVLTEAYRYDSREGYLRPYRSHGCKHCAAVVLKMDHHCPWIGTCVGARNYKYFYNFLQYASLYTLYVTLSLLIANASPSNPFGRTSVDAQQIVIISLAGFFALFTCSLLFMHTRMMLHNMTTIEEIGMQRIRQRERAALSRVYGFFAWGQKKRARKEWDQEWGRLGKEGNVWWLGSRGKNWRMVMGNKKLGWFLPIQASPTPDDGLNYVPNPRFSKEGIWRKREEWPEELR